MYRKALVVLVTLAVLSIGGILINNRLLAPVGTDGSSRGDSREGDTWIHVDYLPSQSIAAMARESSLIVRGKLGQPLGSWNLLRNPSDPVEEAEDIRPATDYEVSVVRYLKGSGPETLVVTLPGGTYKMLRSGLKVRLLLERN